MEQASKRTAQAPAGLPSPGRVWLCMVLLVSLTFTVDISSTFVALGGLYAIPILVSLWLRNFRITLGVTLLCCLLTLEEIVFVDRGPSGTEVMDPAIFRSLVGNHLVQVASLLFVCLIGRWRLRDERELEESSDTNATTLGSIAEGVITIDATGRITYLNPLAEQMTGCASEQALGQPLDAVLRLCDEVAQRVTIDDLPPDLVGPR